jgi:GNAT superfamily N-acetyltransferase
MHLRAMQDVDLEPIAALSLELGYPISIERLAENLGALAASPDHLLRVAIEGGRVAGWIDAALNRTLFEPAWVEVEGLVVAAASRGRGLGAALLREVEAWARELGVAEVRLGCRVTRPDAHGFYERIGYRISKTQHRFVRAL